ncbi:hypothetical protein KFK09_008664 [Dendrobium nobile]|uniref:Uncharacterized protein n=1 Tax=Dendrobium nobile TaxID=94219 RepID=A0A8T3BRH3_DENNO|nr:hypothetical protein KFK09_008664 [Dendrobium nobile]
MESINFWNCRGARKREASLYLREIVKDYKGFFVGLTETKISSLDSSEVNQIIGSDWDYFFHPSIGNSGGILILWKKAFTSFEMVDHSSQVVIGKIITNALGFVGPSYTWCDNKEGNSRIWERLDRCLLNSKAIHKVPFVKTYPATWNIVLKAWKKMDYGSNTEIIKRKLRRGIKALYYWNRNKCRDLQLLRDELKKEILLLQTEEANEGGLSVDKLKMLRNKVQELNVTLSRLSTWWNQRSKVRWQQEGDVNSNFFHQFASIKRNGNMIWQVKDEIGSMVDDLENIEMISKEDVVKLNMDFTKEELTKAVFMQGKNKSPGLDGITLSFFKFYWKIVEDETWKAIDDFFKTGVMLEEWKDTLLILIPKIKKPLVPSNYRPISLCQSTYKFVDTMILNRMKGFIANCITEEQAAFLHGRSISDHCLLAQEVIHKLRMSKRKKGLMAVKLDMEQAYDSMNLETLSKVLSMFGFPRKMNLLIMECVRNVRFSFIINGKTSKWICAENGFRQGLAIKMNNIIMDFCLWTGLRVNNAKSQILFSKDSIMLKLNTWGSKCLSLAGKMTLAKTSLLSLPNFFSAHSMVPKRVLHEVDRCCRNFIWHKRDGKKGMHYIAWRMLCKPKSQGGFSFPSAVRRAGPLKARLTWRVLKNQDSLLFQNLNAKYGDSWWSGGYRHGKSTTWKILNEGAVHLKPILRWRVVDGAKINVIKDIWLLDKSLNEWPITVNCNDLDGLYLCHFITDLGNWNLEELRRFFTEEIIVLIRQLPINNDLNEDFLEEINFPSGKSITARAVFASKKRIIVKMILRKMKLSARSYSIAPITLEIIEPQNNVEVQNAKSGAECNSLELMKTNSSEICLKNNFSILEEALQVSGMEDIMETGAKKKEASLYLKEIVKDNEGCFIGLVETKISNIDRLDVDRVIGRDWDFFHHPTEGTSGGILILWNRNNVSFEVMDHSSQAVIGVLKSPLFGSWMVGTVYANKDYWIRRSLWEMLEKAARGDISSIFGGDFNCLLSRDDKKGGKRFLFSNGPQEMKLFMTNNDFHDVGTIGPRYTWCNNKDGNMRIWERLDRCLLNATALQRVPLARVRHLARITSDHCPIAFKVLETQYKTHFIIFEETWKSYPVAWSIVSNAWRRTDYGNEIDVLQRKLRRSLRSLFFWSKNKCKSLNVLKEDLKKEIVDL